MSVTTYLIESTIETDLETGEPLYWSNLDGWVDKASADAFMKSETLFLSKPSGGVWVEVF